MVWNTLALWFVLPVGILSILAVAVWLLVRFHPWAESPPTGTDDGGGPVLGDYR